MTERRCVDCGVDISERGGNAKRCKHCSHKGRRSISNAANKRLRERSRESRRMLSREEKRIDTCTVSECDKPHKARGLCGMHYAREIYGSQPTTKNKGIQCSFPQCDREANSRGLCGTHYEAQRLGRPLRRLDQLSHRRSNRKQPQALVCSLCGVEFVRAYERARNFCSKQCQRKAENASRSQRQKLRGPRKRQILYCAIQGCTSQRRRKDLCTLHSKLSVLGSERYFAAKHVRRPVGSVRINGDGYSDIKVANNRWVKHHRHVMEQKLGRKLVKCEEVHHVNGDRTNNRIENLELWSSSQPPGQRVVDKLTWTREIVQLYGDLLDRGLLAV